MDMARYTCSSIRLGPKLCLLFVSSVCLLYMVTASEAQRVDCRKFVFAPLCRGVAAKRGYSGGEEDIYLDSEDKFNGVGSYPTVPPLMSRAHKERVSRAQLHAPPALIPAQTRKTPEEQSQGLKGDTLYDWYLSNAKRATMEADAAAYDY